MIISTSE